MVDLWRDFWIRETGTGQQVAQLHDSYMMMMKSIRRSRVSPFTKTTFLPALYFQACTRINPTTVDLGSSKYYIKRSTKRFKLMGCNCVAGCVDTALRKSVVPPSSGWNHWTQRLHHADLKHRPVGNCKAKGWGVRGKGGGHGNDILHFIADLQLVHQTEKNWRKSEGIPFEYTSNSEH